MTENKPKTAFIKVCVPVEDGKIIDREIPEWALNLSMKINWPYGQLTMTTRDPMNKNRIYIEIGGWNEQFFVRYQENGSFDVEFSPYERPHTKNVENLDGVVRAIQSHIEKWTRVNIKKAF